MLPLKSQEEISKHIEKLETKLDSLAPVECDFGDGLLLNFRLANLYRMNGNIDMADSYSIKTYDLLANEATNMVVGIEQRSRIKSYLTNYFGFTKK